MKSFPISISASRIRYEITRGNFGGAFAVKNMTGAIYVAGQLDYETRKRVRIFLEFSNEIQKLHSIIMYHAISIKSG